MVPNIIKKAYVDGKVGGCDACSRQVEPDAATFGQISPIAEGVELTEQKRAGSASQESPGGLCGNKGEMRDDRRGDPEAGEVGPEEDLGIPGHPTLKFGPRVVVGCRDLMEDPA